MIRRLRPSLIRVFRARRERCLGREIASFEGNQFGEGMTELRRPILVVGMHRSGTSMVAGVLARLVNDPVEPRRQPTNPHGQYERVDLRPYLDLLLLMNRSTWRHPDSESSRWQRSFFSDALARRAVHRLGRGERVWKDPRLALTLPVWLRHISQPRLVYVLRDPVDVAASLLKRDAMPVPTAGALWSSYVTASIEASPSNEAFVVSHRRALENPDVFVSELADWLSIDDEQRRSASVMSVTVAATKPPPIDRSTLPPATEELWSRIETWNGPLTIDASVVTGLPPSPYLRSATLAELTTSAGRAGRRMVSGSTVWRSPRRWTGSR